MKMFYQSHGAVVLFFANRSTQVFVYERNASRGHVRKRRVSPRATVASMVNAERSGKPKDLALDAYGAITLILGVI